MSKFFCFMDNLPIVRILQIFALIHFAISVATHIPNYFYQVQNLVFVSNPSDRAVEHVFMIISMAVSGVFRVSSDALILLGLAQIIKIMKENKNDRN